MKKRAVVTEKDIVKEIGSICAGNSTLAFSRMINRSILLESPELVIIKFRDIEKILAGKDSIVVGIHCQILSGLLGNVSLLFKEKSAYEFVSIFGPKVKQTPGFLTQLGVSIIKEIGNVVISAYSGAMGLLMNLSVIPSIPVLSSGPLKEVIRFGMTLCKEDDKIFVHTMTFRDEQKQINGSFYLLLQLQTVNRLTKAMRKQLKSISKIKENIKQAYELLL